MLSGWRCCLDPAEQGLKARSMTSRAFIAGCSGFELTPDETAFFRDAKPWGFILFKRNVDNARAGAGALRRPARRRSGGPMRRS